MEQKNELYPSFANPFLTKTSRPLPEEMAIIGAGTIGPDIGYYIRSALPDKKLYMVDIVEEPLKKAEIRFRSYAEKAVARKKLRKEQAQSVLKNIVYTTNYAHIKTVVSSLRRLLKISN